MAGSLSVEEIRHKMNTSPINELMKDLDTYDEFLTAEYIRITEPYRIAMHHVTELKEKRREEDIKSCDHDFERFCEFHNDVYFTCRKCGYEK